jgi:peroxiredoxin
MRVRDETVEGPNPYRWQDMTTEELFNGKKVLVFALPGAFTPTCSTYQLPDYEKSYEYFKNFGIDEIYCLSVNDAFVMNAWAEDQGVRNIKMLPDGSGEFTRKMGMLVKKDNLGFGMRSWRYAMIVQYPYVDSFWPEPDFCDDAEDDPYGESSPQHMLKVVQRLNIS